MIQIVLENLLATLALPACLAAIIWFTVLSRRLKLGVGGVPGRTGGPHRLDQAPDMRRHFGIRTAPVSSGLDQFVQLVIGCLPLALFLFHVMQQDAAEGKEGKAPVTDASQPFRSAHAAPAAAVGMAEGEGQPDNGLSSFP